VRLARTRAGSSSASAGGSHAIWVVRMLVLADCALAGAWLAGASGIRDATRVVTMLACIAITVVYSRQAPAGGHGSRARQVTRLIAATAFVLTGVIALTLILG